MWRVEINWHWGADRPYFSECEISRIENMSMLQDTVKLAMQDIATRRSFDCGRGTHPLHPCITSVRGIEEGADVKVSLDELGLAGVMESEIKAIHARLTEKGGE